MEPLSELAQQVAIDMYNVDKEFYFYKRPYRSLRGLFIQFFKRSSQELILANFALHEISLSIGASETWALIGPNGAGKSTLLRIMAGIYWPNKGQVITRGRLAALIELGAGFHPDLTGRENIFLYGNILGLRNNELKELYENIVEFSGIKKFIDTPVKYYSSGMSARLGFSVATAVKPDILLLDEILAIGDIDFYDRCLERIQNFQSSGCTIVIATHDLKLAETFATRSVWIDNGRIRLKGKVTEVIRAYRESFYEDQISNN